MMSAALGAGFIACDTGKKAAAGYVFLCAYVFLVYCRDLRPKSGLKKQSRK